MQNNPLSEKSRLAFVSLSGEDTWVARQIAREISLPSVAGKRVAEVVGKPKGAEIQAQGTA
jgi:hypothetical protein